MVSRGGFDVSDLLQQLLDHRLRLSATSVVALQYLLADHAGAESAEILLFLAL